MGDSCDLPRLPHHLVKAYLNRLGFQAAAQIPPTIESLRRLQAAHIEKVPYENIDIHIGRPPVTLDPAASARRVALGYRGGYCFILAGAFGALLHTLNFNVMLLSANIGGDPPNEKSWGNHVVVVVCINGTWWVADVGLGDGPMMPFQLCPLSKWEEQGWHYAFEARTNGWRFTHHPGVGSFGGFELDSTLAF